MDHTQIPHPVPPAQVLHEAGGGGLGASGRGAPGRASARELCCGGHPAEQSCAQPARGGAGHPVRVAGNVIHSPRCQQAVTPGLLRQLRHTRARSQAPHGSCRLYATMGAAPQSPCPANSHWSSLGWWPIGSRVWPGSQPRRPRPFRARAAAQLQTHSGKLLLHTSARHPRPRAHEPEPGCPFSRGSWTREGREQLRPWLDSGKVHRQSVAQIPLPGPPLTPLTASPRPASPRPSS